MSRYEKKITLSRSEITCDVAYGYDKPLTSYFFSAKFTSNTAKNEVANQLYSEALKAEKMIYFDLSQRLELSPRAIILWAGPPYPTNQSVAFLYKFFEIDAHHPEAIAAIMNDEPF